MNNFTAMWTVRLPTAFVTFCGSVVKVGRVVRNDYQYYNPSAKIYLEGIVLGGVP
jgi:hypothetical protein